MASTYISRTLASNGQKKGTISVWFKVGGLGTERAIITSYYDATYHASILLSSNDQIDVFDYRSGYVSRLLTTRLFKDVGAWYHLVYEFDSTNGVADDRNKLWINGVQETSFSSRTNYGSSASTSWDTDYSFRIGARNSDQYWNGDMSHFYFIQGYNYAASTFGSTDATSGIWTINTSASVDYDGTGGNSCFLKMEDRTNLDLDSGDNSLTMTTTGNLTATYDTPSNNFATLNPLTKDEGGAKTYSNGNTTVAETANSWTSAHSSLAVSAGKWYFESKVTYTSSDEAYIGCAAVSEINSKTASTFYLGQGASIGYYTNSGAIYKDSSSTSYGNSVTTGQIVGVALDITNELAYFSINGVWQNSADPVAGSGGVAFPTGMTAGEFICLSVSPNESYLECNYGNGYFGTTAVSTSESDDAGIGSFEYDVPTGYYALCTKNIKAYGG